MGDKRVFLIKIFDICRQIDKAENELKIKLIHDAEDIYDEHFNEILNEQTTTNEKKEKN